MLVRQWMMPNPVTVGPDDSLLTCRNRLKEKRIRRLPVVEDGRVVGIVSDRDVRSASASSATTLEVHELQYLLSELKVRDFMTANPITITPDRPVVEAAMIMLDSKIGGLPVTEEDGTLVGVLTDNDIFKLLVEITGVRQGGLELDFAIPDSPGGMRGLLELLRGHQARIVSVLTAYEDGRRHVTIRIRSMEEAAEAALLADLRADGRLTGWVRSAAAPQA